MTVLAFSAFDVPLTSDRPLHSTGRPRRRPGGGLMKQLLCVVTAALCLAATAAAQEVTTGSICGTVSDPQGLALPGVAVTVTSPQGPRTVVTDAQGRFFAPFLTPGTYVVRAELS